MYVCMYAHFYTASGLAWKTSLKKTKINLKLLTDPDMVLMFEQGIRGGITQTVNKMATANNPYMEITKNDLILNSTPENRL